MQLILNNQVITFATEAGDPFALSGLACNFDASDSSAFWSDTAGTSAITNGDDVARALDLSDEAVVFEQSTSSNRPTWQTNVQNGLSVLEYDGSDYLESNATISTADYHTSSSISIYAVMKQDGTAANHTLFHMGPSGSGRVLLHPTFGDIIYADLGDSGGQRSLVSQPAGWDDNWHIVEVQRDGASNTTISVDGVLLTTDSSITGTIATNTSNLAIGALVGGSFGFTGQIGQILIYNRLLDSTENTGIRNALNDKWAVF